MKYSFNTVEHNLVTVNIILYMGSSPQEQVVFFLQILVCPLEPETSPPKNIKSITTKSKKNLLLRICFTVLVLSLLLI